MRKPKLDFERVMTALSREEFDRVPLDGLNIIVGAYIADPMKTELYQTILAVDSLLGKNKWAADYLEAYSS